MKFWARVHLLVNHFRAFCNGLPTIEFANALVCLHWIMLVVRNDPYRIRNGSNNI